MAKGWKSWRVLAVGALLLPVLGMASPAGAAVTGDPEVLYVPSVVIVNPLQPDTARIVGVYRCFGGDPIHLWVSAKQGGPDPSAEGAGFKPASQGGATAWYDTNVVDVPSVNCDGSYHVATVTVGRHGDKARLTSGSAWVQFCLVAPGEGEFGIVASQSEFARVVGVR